MAIQNPQPSASGARSFRALLRQVLHLQESPQRTALAFSIGVFIAFSPAYGLHMALAVLCSWLFGLNFVALLAGAFVNNPWTFVPILGATYWTGALLLGRTDSPAFTWQDMSFAGMYQQIIPYALPFILGGVVLSIVGALLTYPTAYAVISKYRRTSYRLANGPLPPSDQVG
jgi:uncharacterized protein (DUF2062 family)